MRILKSALMHIGLFFAVMAALFSLLVLAAAIPSEAIRENMEESALTFKSAEPFAFNGERLCAVADNYADAILLNITWCMGGESPLRSAIVSAYYLDGAHGENASLYLAVTQNPAPNTDYTRYWHGAAALLRPLHLVMSVGAIRRLGLAVILALALVTLLMLLRRRHFAFAAAFALSLCAVGVWNLRLSLEYQSAFIVALSFCPLFLHFERGGDGLLTLLAVASGAACAFFDFLTCETLSLLLPLVLTVSVRAKEGRLGDRRGALTLIAKCAAAWASAYLGAFLLKWALATVVCGENKFAAALSSAGVRAFGDVAQAGLPLPLAAPLANLSVLFGATARLDIPRVFLALALCAALIGSVLYLFRAQSAPRGALCALAILGGAVLVRYILLANHSYLHEFFTYRALASTVCALLCGVFLCIGRTGKGRRR